MCTYYYQLFSLTLNELLNTTFVAIRSQKKIIPTLFSM